MDLAGTPAIPGQSPSPARTRGDVDGARLLTIAEAAEPAFVAAWEALALRAVEPNPFFEPWFLLPSLAQFANPGNCSVFAFYDGARLAGIMPLATGHSYYGYPLPHRRAWLHDNAFCGAPLVAKGCELAFWGALLENLDKASSTALLLHLPQLPGDGPLTAALDAVLAEDARPAYTALEGERAMLSSSLGPEAYFGNRP